MAARHLQAQNLFVVFDGCDLNAGVDELGVEGLVEGGFNFFALDQLNQGFYAILTHVVEVLANCNIENASLEEGGSGLNVTYFYKRRSI